MKYILIILLSGCSINASIGEYSCDKETSNKRAEFVLACHDAESNNLNQCISASTKLFCDTKND